MLGAVEIETAEADAKNNDDSEKDFKRTGVYDFLREVRVGRVIWVRIWVWVNDFWGDRNYWFSAIGFLDSDGGGILLSVAGRCFTIVGEGGSVGELAAITIKIVAGFGAIIDINSVASAECAEVVTFADEFIRQRLTNSGVVGGKFNAARNESKTKWEAVLNGNIGECDIAGVLDGEFKLNLTTSGEVGAFVIVSAVSRYGFINGATELFGLQDIGNDTVIFLTAWNDTV